MKKESLCLVLSFMTCVCYGQSNSRMSLRECIDYALERSEVLKQSECREQLNKLQLNDSKMNFLPDLYLNVNQNFNFGRGLLEDNTYGNQTLSNTNFGISSSITLFDGLSNFYTKKREKLNYLASQQTSLKEKDNLTISIITLYLQVLLNRELYKMASEQLNFSTVQIENTKNLVEQGKKSNTELLEVESQVAKDKLNLIQAKNNLQLSLFNLAQKIDYEDYKVFDVLESNISEMLNDNDILLLTPDDIYLNAYSNMAIINENKLILESYKKDINIAKASYFPTISLNLQYNNNYYHNFHLSNYQENISFKNQFKNNGGEIISLSFSYPLFDKNKARNSVKRAKMNYIIKQSEMIETEKQLMKDVQDSHLNAILSKEKYNAAEIAVHALKSHFEQIRNRYELGKSNFYDYNESKNNLLQSMFELTQAKYDYAFRLIILEFYNSSEAKIVVRSDI